MGYISDINITAKNNTLIFIQDLHSNSSAQRNIANILKLISQNADIGKVIIEGAPYGKIDTSIFDSLPNNIKLSVAQNLLSKGMLSGAELFSIENAYQNMYGIEKWNVYINNLLRASQLLNDYEFYKSDIKKFTHEMISQIKKNTSSA